MFADDLFQAANCTPAHPLPAAANGAYNVPNRIDVC
jgi:hypothetical protein